MRRAKDVRRLVVEKRREHSRKPDCVRDRIERLVVDPYLELFARETKRGWECWGDQVALFDKGVVSTRRQPSRLINASEAARSWISPR
jgi:N6-adenosine-specific RNA methylase IME4